MSEMKEEFVTQLNQLIEGGDHKAVELYITEKNIKPDDAFYYKAYTSRYVTVRPSPVGLAVKCGKVEVVKTLLELGFPVFERYKYFDSIFPIHVACEHGHVEVVKVLVEDYGVDVTDRDNCYYKSPLVVAAEKGQIDVLDYFLKKGISVDHKFGERGESILHAAAETNQSEVCEFLLSKGADVDICNEYDLTPLMFAARSKSYASARVLLEAEADVDMTSDQGETAFFEATQHGDVEMLKLLSSYDADPEIANNYHRSPLHAAASSNNYDIAYYLVNELNVTLNPPAYYEKSRGKTVCAEALQQRNYDIVRLLFNAGYDPSVELAEFEESEDEGSEDSLPRRHFGVKKKGNKALLKELREMVARPRSLFSLCILTVRRILGRDLQFDLEHLPIPEILKEEIVACGENKRKTKNTV